MKVVNIDFENKTFTTDDGTEYPFIFDVNPSIAIEEFQTLVDELEEKINELTNPYHTFPEIKSINDIIKQSTSADGWKYNKRNKRR